MLWQKIIFAYHAQLLDVEWHLPENEWTSKRNLCREPRLQFCSLYRAFVAGFDLRSFMWKPTWISSFSGVKKDITDQKIFRRKRSKRHVGSLEGLLLWSCDAGAPDGPDISELPLKRSTFNVWHKKRRQAKIMEKTKTPNISKSSKFSNFSKYFFRDITETQRSPAVNEVTEGFNSCWLQRKDPKDKDKTVLDLGQKVFFVFQQNKRWQFFVCQQFSKVLWLWKEVTTFSGFLSFC